MLLLVGCQSTPSAEVAVNPAPVRVAASQAEPVEEKKLDRPPSRAHDLAPPEQAHRQHAPVHAPGGTAPESAELPELPTTSELPVPQATANLPEPSYPVATPSLPHQLPPATTSASATPQALSENDGLFEQDSPVAHLLPPRSHRPVPGLPPSVRPTGYPGPTHSPLPPGAISPRPPRLPGQVTPPPHRGYDPQRERELEQAYRQSRADALNTKYHRGRPVYNAHSPEVDLSSTAPLPPIMPPSIPGQHGVSDAFKASQIKRDEWHSYRSSPTAPNPGIPGRY